MTEVFLQATIFRHINRRIECPPEEKNTLWNNYFSCLQYLLPYSEVSVNYNTDCIIASLSETRRDWKFRLMSHRKFSASTSLAETTWLGVVLLWRCKIYGHKFQNEFHAVKIFFIHQLLRTAKFCLMVFRMHLSHDLIHIKYFR